MNRAAVIVLAAGAVAVAAIGYWVNRTAKPDVQATQIGASETAPAVSSSITSGAANIANGKAVYDAWCGACHDPGPGHPGTQSLDIKYGGKVPAALEERTDLSPETTAYFVRNGFALMPFFRKTEISDADLRDLSAYLAKKE
ncbi:MAG: c-type cytochrome [Parvularculaceae bacterium]